MNILPKYCTNINEMKEGEVFSLNDYCRKRQKSTKCSSFYTSITKPGFYECPCGFNVYATEYSLNRKEIYTSFVLNENKNKKLKGKQGIKNWFNRNEFTRLIGLSEQDEKVITEGKKESDGEIAIITSIFHEIRKLSRDLDESGKYFQKYTQNQDEVLSNIIDNILQTLNMIMIRVNSYELMRNPIAITTAKQNNIPVYKKFDKCRYILTSKAKSKNVYITFENESHFCINGYEVFDLVPYILLDNAVKYCPNHNSISVLFDDHNRKVTVSNWGPPLEENEVKNLGVRGFRGKNAQEYPGSGLGLDMLRQICEIHSIKIEYKISQDTRETNGHEYSMFNITILFGK